MVIIANNQYFNFLTGKAVIATQCSKLKWFQLMSNHKCRMQKECSSRAWKQLVMSMFLLHLIFKFWHWMNIRASSEKNKWTSLWLVLAGFFCSVWQPYCFDSKGCELTGETQGRPDVTNKKLFLNNNNEEKFRVRKNPTKNVPQKNKKRKRIQTKEAGRTETISYVDCGNS